MAMSPTRMTSSRRSDTTTAKSGEALHLRRFSLRLAIRRGATGRGNMLGRGRLIGYEKDRKGYVKKSFII